eukprot:m51a1_g10850 hypothetical protein (690) ;mRNA; r:10141-12636
MTKDDKNSNKPLDGVRVCVCVEGRADKTRLAASLASLGARVFAGEGAATLSHVIVEDDAARLESVRKRTRAPDLAFVTPAWVEQCAESNKKMSESDFCPGGASAASADFPAFKCGDDDIDLNEDPLHVAPEVLKASQGKMHEPEKSDTECDSPLKQQAARRTAAASGLSTMSRRAAELPAEDEEVEWKAKAPKKAQSQEASPKERKAEGSDKDEAEAKAPSKVPSQKKEKEKEEAPKAKSSQPQKKEDKVRDAEAEKPAEEKSKAAAAPKGRAKAKAKDDAEDSEDEKPKKPAAKRGLKKKRDDDDSDEDFDGHDEDEAKAPAKRGPKSKEDKEKKEDSKKAKAAVKESPKAKDDKKATAKKDEDKKDKKDKKDKAKQSPKGKRAHEASGSDEEEVPPKKAARGSKTDEDKPSKKSPKDDEEKPSEKKAAKKRTSKGSSHDDDSGHSDKEEPEGSKEAEDAPPKKKQKGVSFEDKADPKAPCVVFTMVPETLREELEVEVKRLGGRVRAEIAKGVTHVVCDHPVRTVKVFQAISLGLWVVEAKWIRHCTKAKKWVDPEPYEVYKSFPGARLSRNAHEKAGYEGLFKKSGYKFHLGPGTNPDFNTFRDIIHSAGGEVTYDVSKADVYVAHEKPKKKLPDTIKVVNEKWVLDSIGQYELQPFKDCFAAAAAAAAAVATPIRHTEDDDESDE